MTRPDPTGAQLDLIGTSCDWGNCNQESVALRWSFRPPDWLPVCQRHRTKDSVTDFTDMDEL